MLTTKVFCDFLGLSNSIRVQQLKYLLETPVSKLQIIFRINMLKIISSRVTYKISALGEISLGQFCNSSFAARSRHLCKSIV
jgi:hypothetical protein